MTRRKRSQRDVRHSPGWRSVAASVVIRAVLDADRGDAEAEEWLQTEGRLLMLVLGLDVPPDAIRDRERTTKRRFMTGRESDAKKEVEEPLLVSSEEKKKKRNGKRKHKQKAGCC